MRRYGLLVAGFVLVGLGLRRLVSELDELLAAYEDWIQS